REPQKNPQSKGLFPAGSGIGGLALHPTEGWLACDTGENTTEFLSADTLQPVRPGLAQGGSCYRFFPDRSCLVSAAGDLIRFLNPGTGEVLRTLQPPESDKGPISGLTFNPEGTLLATAWEENKHVKLWEVANGRLVADLFVGGGTVKNAFSPDGRTLAV